MSLPRYSAYKKSGVRELTDIPAHWSTPPLYLRYSVELGKMLDASRITGNHLVPYLRNVDVQWGRINFDDLPVMDIAPTEMERYTVTVGDLLVCEGGEVGRAAVVPPHAGPMGFQKALHRLRSIGFSEVPRYMFHVFRWAADAGLFSNNGQSTIAHLTGEQLRKYRFPCPPRLEQLVISQFLDEELLKTESLIGEQEKLIALLTEKHQATISHAVTKGLNPNAAMRASGMAWLGDVPAHWISCSVRRVLKKLEQGWSPECFNRPAQGSEWGVLKTGCVNGGRFNPEENKALPDNLEPDFRIEVHDGDLLMSRASGSPALVGATAYVEVTPPRLMLSDKTFRLIFWDTILPKFVAMVFSAKYMRDQIEQAISGADGLANNLPQSSLKSFAIAIPPIQEQRQIVDFISREEAKLEKLRIEANQAIALLKERRAALIAAAVTGQIDVRGRAKDEIECAELIA